MDTETYEVLKRIEQHLATIAEAASLKVTRAGYKKNTENRLRAITKEDKPSPDNIALAQLLRIDVGHEWAKFKANCETHDKRYANFESAFRKWLLNNAYPKKQF